MNTKGPAEQAIHDEFEAAAHARFTLPAGVEALPVDEASIRNWNLRMLGATRKSLELLAREIDALRMETR